MIAKVIILCSIAVLAFGHPEGFGRHEDHHEPTAEEQPGMPFKFSYEVKELGFGHNAESDGKVVNGKYSVVLPDGRTQKVVYTADDHNGYQAEVTYEGEAHFPETKPKAPAPTTAPATPAPTIAPDTPAPTIAPDTPAPTTAPATSDPAHVPSKATPSAAPSTPASGYLVPTNTPKPTNNLPTSKPGYSYPVPEQTFDVRSSGN